MYEIKKFVLNIATMSQFILTYHKLFLGDPCNQNQNLKELGKVHCLCSIVTSHMSHAH